MRTMRKERKGGRLFWLETIESGHFVSVFWRVQRWLAAFVVSGPTFLSEFHAWGLSHYLTQVECRAHALLFLYIFFPIILSVFFFPFFIIFPVFYFFKYQNNKPYSFTFTEPNLPSSATFTVHLNHLYVIIHFIFP